jgi:hypothetical protein
MAPPRARPASAASESVPRAYLASDPQLEPGFILSWACVLESAGSALHRKAVVADVNQQVVTLASAEAAIGTIHLESKTWTNMRVARRLDVTRNFRVPVSVCSTRADTKIHFIAESVAAYVSATDIEAIEDWPNCPSLASLWSVCLTGARGLNC